MNKLIGIFVTLLLVGCSTEESTLPILGERVEDPTTGKLRHYQAPTFKLTNQLNQSVSSEQLEGKIHVVDFFFTSCPTICPTMTGNLKMVEAEFAEVDEVALLSFSIDSKHDTPERLLVYANRYSIDHDKWSLLTGDRDDIFEIAKDYKVRAFDEGPNTHSPDMNLIHDGTFVLVDGDRHIRGYYNGLEQSDVKRLIKDIKTLTNK